MGALGHAVDGPVGAPLLVANGDAEAPIVGANNLDELAGRAPHLQLLPLARVPGPNTRPIVACNKKDKFINGIGTGTYLTGTGYRTAQW